MDHLHDPGAGTLRRLGEQGEFLQETYQAEFAKDPRSRATQSSRSHTIALWHTIRQIYGKTVARGSFSLIDIKMELLHETAPFS